MPREGTLLCSRNQRVEDQEIAIDACRADNLSHAYRLVRANGGSAGVDGVTFRDIRVKEGEAEFLAELEEALKKYGLYKVPTTAGWTKVHALR